MPDPSISPWRAGSARTSKIASGEASITRETDTICSVMDTTVPVPGRRCSGRGAPQRIATVDRRDRLSDGPSSRWRRSPPRQRRSPQPNRSPRPAGGRRSAPTIGRCGADVVDRAPSRTTRWSITSRWRGDAPVRVVGCPASTRLHCSCCGPAVACPSGRGPHRSHHGSSVATARAFGARAQRHRVRRPSDCAEPVAGRRR